ncbi:DUF2795 domain-containing protein [Dictyobacter formicarum]|uniref:DUF2795 domain-containing protein n=1 Tax=Dictyobacter formicarum TaxID=2778368 RepID=A0ABQ3VIX7_9CHLR|nr:DUF2795 domain-containing protein [Dictyobacter formicarum]GHO85568.1 hypothetical protein KSZ_35740 [Dictyobacter formicarum]
MNINAGQIDQILNSLPYPISKDSLIQQARSRGVNDQIISMMEKLPDKTFNSADDLKSSLSGFGNLGGMKI